MSEIETKLDEIIIEIKEFKQIAKDQIEALEELVSLFSKYDQELLMENDEIREG